MVTFEEVDDEELSELFPEEKPSPRGRHEQQPQCLCGRFAKFLGIRHYYNGHYDCATMSLECKRCGPVDIELV